LVARKEGFGKGSIAKRGKLSTVDLLELTNLDRLLLTWQALFTFLLSKLP